MPKILIADDDFTVGMQVEEMLTALGYDVVGQAGSGQQAVKMARDLKPDMILIDIVMPGEINGIEAAEKIRAESEIPIVFVSGYGESEHIEQAKQIGPFGYVMKPFAEREIKASVEIALHKRKMELELKEVYDRVKQNEEILSAAIHKSPIPTAVGASDGSILSFNEALVSLIGYRQEEIKDVEDWTTKLYPDKKYRAFVWENIQQALRGETQDCTEFVITTKDGTTKTVNFHTAHFEEGLIIQIIDITIQKRAEKALKTSEQRLRTITDTALDSIFAKDLNGRYTFVNPAMIQLMGCTKADLIEKVPEEVFDKEDAAIVNEVDERTLNGENINEIRSLTIAGKPYTFHTIQVPLRDSDGSITGMSGIVRDITDVEQTQVALRESEEAYRAIFEQAVDSIVIIDSNSGELLEFNDKTCEHLGYTRQEFEGIKVSDIDVIESNQEVTEHVKLILKDGLDVFETKHRKKNGEILDIQVNTKTISIAGREVIQGIWRDITDENRAKTELKKAHDELERLVEERTADLLKTNEQLMNEIKEHNQTEKAQQESEERYRTLVETASRTGQAIILIQNRDQVEACCVFANDAVSDITGYSQKELEQMSWLDIVHPLHRNPAKERYRKRILREIIEDIFEITIVSKRGTEIPIELTSIVTEFQGEEALVVFFKDIGDRKRSEESLRESEERFRHAFENANIGVCLVSIDGHLIKVNDCLCEILGYSREELEGMPINAITHQEDIDLSPEYLQQSISGTMDNIVYEKRILHSEGYYGWVQICSSIVRDLQGEPLYFISHVQDITDRKRAEEALKESEEKFSTLFRTSPTYTALVTLDDGRFIEVNEAFTKITGYQREEVIGRTSVEVGIWVNRKNRERLVELVREQGGFQEEGVQLVRKNGEPLNGLWSAEMTELGGEKYIISVLVDVTEQKLAQAKLRESEERFSLFMDHFPGVAFIKDINGRLVYANEVLEKRGGYKKKGDWYGKTNDQIWPPEAATLFSEADQKVLAKGRSMKLVEQIPYPDGQIHTQITNKFPIYEKGELTYLGGVGLDITNLKQIEAALRESETRYKNLVELSPEAVFVHQEGIIVYLNPAGLKILGAIDHEEFIGKPVLDFTHPDYHEITKKRIRQMHKRKTALSPIELKYIRSDKKIIDVVSTGTYIEYFGKPSILSVSRDITDQKLAELALKGAHDDLELRIEQRTAELAKSNELLKNEMKERKQGEDKIRTSLKEKDVLLKEIHHRVRNNLQVISSLLQLARTRTDNKEASDLLLESYSRIHTMGLIHSQLYQSDRFDKIDMHQHLQEVVTNLSQLYGNDRFVTLVISNANIYLSLTQAIPCAIAINQLISNVFKHAYPKGEKGTVEVFMEQTPDGKLRVTVKDHGIGIPKEIDIFETESLGLKLTRNLVLHQLKGQLQITRNNGTEALLEFPVLEEDE